MICTPSRITDQDHYPSWLRFGRRRIVAWSVRDRC